jgi:predicted Zn-dependent protease
VQQEIELGTQYAAQIETELPIIRDPEIQRAMDEIVQPILAQTSRTELTWTVRIVNSDVVNAFAVPGGHLYFNRGLIQAADRYDELAGVMGHEMGHVDLRHSMEQMEKANTANTGVGIAYILLGRQPGGVERAALNVTAGAVFAKFSRDDERDSDRAAVRYLTQAGIDPSGMARMFETLQALNQRDPSAIEGFFASHPMPADRIEDVWLTIRETPGAVALTQSGQRDHPGFDRLRRLLGRYPQPPPSDQ